MLRLRPRKTRADLPLQVLTLTLIYDGGSRTDAAWLSSVALHIARGWVVRFKASKVRRRRLDEGRSGDVRLTHAGNRILQPTNPWAMATLARSLRRAFGHLRGGAARNWKTLCRPGQSGY